MLVEVEAARATPCVLVASLRTSQSPASRQMHVPCAFASRASVWTCGIRPPRDSVSVSSKSSDARAFEAAGGAKVHERTFRAAWL